VGVSDKDALDPCIPAAFCVDDLITNHVRLVRINMVLFHQVQNHLGRRLSALAVIIRGMRADREIFKGSNLGFAQIVLKLPVNDVNVFKGKIGASDTGLIGHNEELIAKFLEFFQGLQRIRKIFHLFDTRKIVLVDDQSSVTIKEDGLSCFNLLSLR